MNSNNRDNDDLLKEWRIYYTKLIPRHKEVIDRHVSLASQIRTWDAIRYFLIDQFHENKGFLGYGKRRRGRDEEAKRVYKGVFFMGKKQVTSFDFFPCQFQGDLEDVMIKEMGTRKGEDPIYLLCVYYNPQFYGKGVACPVYDKKEWLLDFDNTITEKDRVVLNAFITGFMSFFDNVIQILTDNHMECKHFLKEKKRLVQYFVPL